MFFSLLKGACAFGAEYGKVKTYTAAWYAGTYAVAVLLRTWYG